MNFIQSCWSCNHKNFLELNAGWIAPEYNLMSWSLSCLQLKRFYSNVILYTDCAAAKVLIDILQLPYNDVICDLDKLNSYDSRMWALPKIYTYSQQNDPFLHIDSDVYIWQGFDESLLGKGLIAQNLEVSTDHYENIMKSLEANLRYIPRQIVEERHYNPVIYAYNAGIFGGADIAFFKDYTRKSLNFIDRNTRDLSKIDPGGFNIFFEQYLFYCLAKKQNKRVHLLIQDIISDNQYCGFDEFTEVPHNKKYLHLLGSYKKYKIVCEQLANRLRHEYPEHYYRIIALFKNKGLPLQRDYYYTVSESCEKDFVSRYNYLKESFKNNTLQMKNGNLASRPAIKPFRSELVRHLIESVEGKDMQKNYKSHLKDAELFERKLSEILSKKFARYSDKYLYGRDINSTTYHEYIFKSARSLLDKKIVADKIIAIIKSRYEWGKINSEDISMTELIHFLKHVQTKTYTAVIPEANNCGYSLVTVDEFDLLLFNIVKKPRHIVEVLNEAKKAFDPVELPESEAEFESLLSGRIKMALKTKIIKAIVE